ncbi:rod shape-determining protein RodA [Candidatus Curtissbacteria bacterium RIFCSPLOWO2_01_FULL_38_11b]|uniref:Rod shape-determining protein RodA n=1 Tax=Candidatus Curtissbacteria bacterium RIFCSPLOWO2_01_FULL_38_11b TaxID=1797725 RepID=A0A1F5GZB8_9BACT|nr:MAG: rod shape-determining protein RodA [Candidatus Curtissbacteria bacterium RIFCSPLOWO2_01_FULL_38_11b]
MKLRENLGFYFPIAILGSISILIISSISKNLAFNQIIFWAIGLLILFVVSQLNYKNWLTNSKIFYFLSLIILGLLLIIGEPIRGSVRWIELSIIRFQPSELAKAATIVYLASFYSQKSAKDLINLFISFALVLPVIILIFIQPDIGNTFAFFAIWLAMSFASGIRLKYMVLLAVVTILVGIFLFEILAPYQKERLITFFNPVSDPLGIGYNLIQSKIAIGSGQLFGKGYGHGTQSQLNFLPEAESDFIFASIVEQLGFVGGAIILISFAWLLTKLISIANSTDRFGQLIVIGVISFLLIQFLINVGMNMGLLPVTGITFPLVSYGGSSLITSLFLLGIILSVKKPSP